MLSESSTSRGRPAHSPYTVLFERPSCKDIALCERTVGGLPALHFQLRALLRNYDTTTLQHISQAPLSVVFPLLELYIAERLVMIQGELAGLANFTAKDLSPFEDYIFQSSVYHDALNAHQQSFVKTLWRLRNFSLMSLQQGRNTKLDVHIRDLQHVLDLTNEGLSDIESFMLQWSTK